MNDSYFLDTNIFVYTFEPEPPEKRDRAHTLIREALADRRGMVSWQVVQEFLNLAVHRFSSPLSSVQARSYLATVLTPLCKVFPSQQLYCDALALQVETGYRFYDALIVASAVSAGVKRLYSEDLQHGRRIRGLEICNPFQL